MKAGIETLSLSGSTSPRDQGALGMASVLHWTAGPPGFPPGGQFAILTGDPRHGSFAVRFRAPAGYKIPTHTHPDDENVTVLSGTFHIAIGLDANEAHGHAVKTGGFWHVPKGTPHMVWFTEDSETQVHGTGPIGITYVNPADDPRNR